MSEQDGVLEAEFVVECVRWALDSEQVRDSRTVDSVTPLADIPDDLDWRRVMAIASGNAVVPLVREALRSRSEDVPELIRSELREQYRTNARRNLLMAGALDEILQEFRTGGIRAIPFKGPVLAEVGYGDLNRREFLDLDVLVSPSDREQASDVLRELGYESTRDIYNDRRVRESSTIQQSFPEYEFRRPSDGVVTDLRWEFTNDHLPSVEALWKRRTERSVAGNAVPALSPTDRFLVQTTHATKHFCRRLAWIADVAVTANSIDSWDSIMDEISDQQLGRRVSISLRLAEDLFDASVPQKFWTNPNVPDDGSLADEMHIKWLNNPIDTTSILDGFLFQTRLHPPSDLARKVVDTVFRPRFEDYESFPLPTPLHPLYYVYRPFRLAYNLRRYRDSSHR